MGGDATGQQGNGVAKEVKVSDLVVGRRYWALYRHDPYYLKVVECDSRGGCKFICNLWAGPDNDQVSSVWRFFELPIPFFPQDED